MSSFRFPLGETVVEKEVCERVVEVRVVRKDAVVLVGVGVLPEQNIRLLQRRTVIMKKAKVNFGSCLACKYSRKQDIKYQFDLVKNYFICGFT